MNQILEYNVNNKKDNNNNNNSDKVVKIFAVVLIIFAIILIGTSIYGKIGNKNNIEKDKTEKVEAQISIDVDGEKALISVSDKKKIQKLVYSWNDNAERTIRSDSNEMEEEIDIPIGKNTLHVKVVDEDGTETVMDKEIESEGGIDIINPVIELSVTEQAKLKIVATDETELSFITYRWNNDEEVKIEAEEGSKRIEEEIEILKGENSLVVIAVDSSNNSSNETKSFTGRTKPIISVQLSADGSSIKIKATDEYGIKDMKFNFNDTDYNINLNNENPKEVEFEQKLATGENKIILGVNNIYGIESTFSGKCNYGDGESDNQIEVIQSNTVSNSTNTNDN